MTQNLFLYGNKVEWVETYKYLGIILNNKLNWSHHIENIANKAIKGINIIKSITCGHDNHYFSLICT